MIELYEILIAFRISPSDRIDRFLEGLRPRMIQVVNGNLTPILEWCPKVKDSETGRYLNSMHLPALYPGNTGPPVLILRALGAFKHDPVLGERLRNIFEPGHHV